MARYLTQNPLPPNKKVYVIGQRGISEELDLYNIPNFGGESSDHNIQLKFGRGVVVEHDPDVAAVVVGFDPDFNYYKLQYAQLCINKNKGTQFLATNLDCVAHVTDAQEWAEAGAMVGAVTAAVGRFVNFLCKHDFLNSCLLFVLIY